jgi:hypothetical protein
MRFGFQNAFFVNTFSNNLYFYGHKNYANEDRY